MSIKNYAAVGGFLMALALTATADTVVFDLENIGADGTPVDTVTNEGVTITIGTRRDTMAANTYGEGPAQECFVGASPGGFTNIPLNAGNVSGSRFISTCEKIKRATPITFTFSEAIKGFGLTTLDLLEKCDSNANVTYTLSGDGGSTSHSISGVQGKSGLDLDFAISSSTFDITTVTFDHTAGSVCRALYGIDDLYVEVAGPNPVVFGNTYISTGAGSEVYGDILANTYLVAGASTVIVGDIQTGAAVTTGATTGIDGNIRAVAAITLGASTVVDGDVCSGAALTLGAGAEYDNYDCSFDAMTYTNNEVIAAQDSYNALTAANVADRNQLNPTIPVDLTLDPNDGTTTHDGTTVVYSATSLTSAAGITLTLDGDYDWVFNITNILSLRAGTKVVLTEGSGGSVTWNVGGYASIGANAETVGTILANGYISTGLGAKARGAVSPSLSSEPAQSYCGGLFSATSYVTIAASSTVSCESAD